jgi:hypothetical protein
MVDITLPQAVCLNQLNAGQLGSRCYAIEPFPIGRLTIRDIEMITKIDVQSNYGTSIPCLERIIQILHPFRSYALLPC